MAKKKETLNKDEEAKAKVKELLKDTSVASLVADKADENKQDLNVNVIKKEKSMDWLQQQLDDALNQVEALETEIIYYKEELQKSQINPPQVSTVKDNGLPPNVVALFQHFERVYEKGYTQAKIAHPEGGTGVLDMFLQYFPQLQNIKRYRYKG